jgi:hypothetical protein
MGFDTKVQYLAMIYYKIGQLLPQKRLTWLVYGMVPFRDLRINRKVLNRCLLAVYQQ